MALVAEVSIPLKVSNLYSYKIPENYPSDLIGKRVIVDFSNKIMSGLVVNITKDIPDIKLKDILDVLDENPIADKEFLKFCKWIADYYFCSLGEVFLAAFPPKTFPQENLYVKINDNYNVEELAKFKKSSSKRKKFINVLTDEDRYIPHNTLKNKYDLKYSYKELKEFRDKNFIDIKYILEDEYTPKTLLAARPDSGLELIDKKLNEIRQVQLKNAPKQSEAFDIICSHYLDSKSPVLLKDIENKYNISSNTVRELEKKGLAEIFEVEIDRLSDVIPELSEKVELKLDLEKSQTDILNSIIKDIEKNQKSNILLHGVTGSGKTLIYMHLIQKVIDEGKQAIVLLPEISLTPQLTDRFTLSFPGKVCAIHSRLTANERYELWQKISDGEFDIVIGPRSAIFSPLKNIGFIIVDEEHDQSYKQDSPAPRYNARDLAAVRGQLLNCPVIFGTATPSMETYYNAINGKYKYYQLLRRAAEHQMPELEFVDLISARQTGAMKGSFTFELLKEVKNSISKDERVIIFQNRRGFSNYVQCFNCGEIPKCENCDTTLTYHSHKDMLLCHYCGYTRKFVNKCSECGHDKVHKIGIGTQRIEEEIEEFFPGVKYARYDSDTTRNKDQQRNILRKFRSGEIELLIGTQMLSKGLDIENVSLVGILNADTDLFMSDIRSSEKTYQIINQVSGRAGRSRDIKGKVVIQTSSPDHYAIASLKKPLNIEFLDKELEYRKDLYYPPYSRLVKIEFTSKSVDKVEKSAQQFYKILPSDNEKLDILPPADPLVKKVRNKYRKIIIIKNSKDLDPAGKELRKILHIAYEHFKREYPQGDLRVTIDIDTNSIV